MLFGWNKVGNRLHFFATCMVALGTLFSTFWIISANSWMQTPDGFAIVDGRFVPVDWWRVVFNRPSPIGSCTWCWPPISPPAWRVAGCGAWLLLKRRATDEARTMLLMAVGLAAVLAPLQIVAGDASGLSVGRNQPAKLAAIEARWETARRVPLTLVRLAQRTRRAHRLRDRSAGAGLDHPDPRSRRRSERPQGLSARRPAAGLDRVLVVPDHGRDGLAMLGIGLVGGVLALAGKLGTSRWFQRLCVLTAPTGFIAVVTGWTTAEVGRQPYVVYGHLRTADAVSPALPAGSVATTLLLFMIVYAIVFTAGIYYMFRLDPARARGAHQRSRSSGQDSTTTVVAARCEGDVMNIDLPLIWAGIIVVGVFMYVLLDGFDLGIGILFSFAPDDAARDKMMNSVAPIWDGNETWLVLGGAGLLAAFPAAYAIILSALYLPLTIMLLGLIFRGNRVRVSLQGEYQPLSLGPQLPVRLDRRDLRAGRRVGSVRAGLPT